MLEAFDSTRTGPPLPEAAMGALTDRSVDACASQRARAQVAQTLDLLEHETAPQRRLVHAGDRIYEAGERFSQLYIVNAGVYKVVTSTADGREQLVSFKFRGDWLGFDGIADGQHHCEAIALDTGEVWAVRYEQLLQAGSGPSQALPRMLEAMSRVIARNRDSLMAVCSLPADARVADFLSHWAQSLTQCGLQSDQITLRITRAEIGNHLGMTLESVSRALSKLAKHRLIRFCDRGRREIHIPDARALSTFAQDCVGDSGNSGKLH